MTFRAALANQTQKQSLVIEQELEMAFRRVRRRYIETRKNSNMTSIIEELLQAIEGNGMTIRTWFEIMDQLANNSMVNQSEFSKGMKMLQNHSTERMRQPVLTAEQVGAWLHTKCVELRLSTFPG